MVGRRVRLVKKGREFSGLCPFHNEKSPSFFVNDDKGFFHCFGCGAHGDVIGFMMRADSLGFPEAVEHLAQEAGLDEGEALARSVLRQNLHILEKLAQLLLEKETVDGVELTTLLSGMNPVYPAADRA